MSPTVKNRLDYLVVFVVLYFFSVGFKTIIYIIVNDAESLYVQSVDILRLNTEIGLFLLYLKQIQLRNSEQKLEFPKILVLSFLWPLSVIRLISK